MENPKSSIQTVIFSGGRGTRNLIEGIQRFNRSDDHRFVFKTSVIVNAYDNGLSTGRIREMFDVLGPSDPRKVLSALIDDRTADAGAIREFFDSRFCEEDHDATEAPAIIDAIADGKEDTMPSFKKIQVYKRLPDGFRRLVRKGLERYRTKVRSEGMTVDYVDFSFANVFMAGLMGERGNLQAALTAISQTIPLSGEILVNSTSSLYLYALREHRVGQESPLLDEAEIVSRRSTARIQGLFLLNRPLSQAQREDLTHLSIGEIQEELQRLSGHVQVNAQPEVLERIGQADIIVFGPGTQYSSLYPTYLTRGLPEAIRKNTGARKVLVTNIGQDFDISDFTACDLYRETIRYLSANLKVPVDPTSLVNQVLINQPRECGDDASNHTRYVLPCLSGFGHHQPHQPGVKDGFMRFSTDTGAGMPLQIWYGDFEHPAQPGKHCPEKLVEVLTEVVTRNPSRLDSLNVQLTRGAILFDIDQTLLDVRIDPHSRDRYEASLLDSHALHDITELLEAGFHLCAITGNDMMKFHQRFTSILVDHLKQRNRLHWIQRLEVYANGASNHVTFDQQGQAREDLDYNLRFQIPEAHMQRIEHQLQTIVDEGYGLDYDDFKEIYDLSKWRYGYNESNGQWFEYRQGGETVIPRVIRRGANAMITLKPYPSERHQLQGRKEITIRRRVFLKVQKTLQSILNNDFKDYQITEAGWSSIDITRCVNKATAVRHYLKNNKLDPSEVIYFGNEFRKGGNDQAVVDEIERITVVSVNQPEEQVLWQANIIFGGDRGVRSTVHHLTEILEIYRRNWTRGRSMPDFWPIPTIQEKIINAYTIKRQEREIRLQPLLQAEPARLIHHHRETVAQLDRSLKNHFHRPVAIVPAAGKGSRFALDVPKPLVEIHGKPVIVRVLENFRDFVDSFLIIVNRNERSRFEKALRHRPEQITLIDTDVCTGEGQAVWSALPFLNDRLADVIVTWADLVVVNPSTIQKTIDEHRAAGHLAMTFPTMFETRPYVTIEHDDFGRPVQALFSDFGTDPNSSDKKPSRYCREHDCSFFVCSLPALEDGLQALHHSGFDPYSNAYDFTRLNADHRYAPVPKDRAAEFKFLYLIRYFHAAGEKMLSLPGHPGAFMGFNTLEELEQIKQRFDHDLIQ
jgi:2-phospho-L-lactate transferase/gluconeogenesis factor (CofD/UPF0052 family)/GTP:adenosylcobinamide-phosphate guanylyltransferase